jgi:hypothetical protein
MHAHTATKSYFLSFIVFSMYFLSLYEFLEIYIYIYKSMHSNGPAPSHGLLAQPSRGSGPCVGAARRGAWSLRGSPAVSRSMRSSPP